MTPSSQIVGTQAVFNVLMGRYKVLTGEFADLMLGYYGETHRRARPRDRRGGRGHRPKKEPIDVRPGRPAQARVGRAASPRPLALQGCDGTDEDVLTYAMFPQVAPKFFAERADGPKNVGKDPVERAAAERAVQAVAAVR